MRQFQFNGEFSILGTLNSATHAFKSKRGQVWLNPKVLYNDFSLKTADRELMY
jgi:hypothetical protein